MPRLATTKNGVRSSLATTSCALSRGRRKRRPYSSIDWLLAQSALRLLLFLFAFSPASVAFASTPALQVRGGLPNVAALAATGGELRVAYLGGSITAAEGWRTLLTAHLRTLSPELTVVEIPAGLPGTGSDLGACRLDRDVLSHRPDLLFVEFAVNDANTPPDQIERTMEGIVRQTRRASPNTDLCFAYTVSTPGLPDLQAGRFPPAAQAMEGVAAHYGIPSVHFGVEVVRRIAAGTLVFKSVAPGDALAFSLDGVHPTATGHRVYFTTLEHALPDLLAAAIPNTTPLPPPLRADNWEGASLRLLDAGMRRGDWRPVSLDDANLRGATKALLPPTWRTAEPGALLEFEFTGTILGFLGIAAPDSGEFRVTVDDLPPVTATFFDSYVTPTFCRQRPWFYPKTLTAGAHRVRIELLNTMLDKKAIKAEAGRLLDDPNPFAPHHLTLSGVLLVAPVAP
jgi:lysophospholipase L1-like esterase